MHGFAHLRAILGVNINRINFNYLYGGDIMIINIITNEKLSASELNSLLATNNWDIHPEEKLQNCIDSSWSHISARNADGQLIGYVRLISDGIRHAYICSMIVHPHYRKNGVGSQIMQEVMSLLDEEKLYPTLVANPGNKAFYEKFGFQQEPKGFTAMCIR
jgi:ribosomal protein S18 acetylase RimI-like enzyme